MMIEAVSSDHHVAVRRLHLDAFPASAEADLVERLRRDGDAIISLVAIEDGRVVGHVMFSRMEAPFKALGLAPLAVATDKRVQGIAARLIQEGIERAQEEGWQGIFVLGDPSYYQRFGFSAQAAAGFDCRYAGPHLMLLALGNHLSSRTGRVDYAPAFSSLE